MDATLALPDIMIEPLVRAALLEDLGRAGDITTDATIPATMTAEAAIVAREAGTIAGVGTAQCAFRLLSPEMRCAIEAPEGAKVSPGDVVMRLSGDARALLSAERTALNFLCRLSGIASATAALVHAVEGHRAGITCTRKTTPGLRALEKAAVRAGGGVNHRFGLDDAVLIKDNHIALAGGIAAAVGRARQRIGHLVKIEVEVDTLDQLEEAMRVAPDAVLLDNMTPEQLTRAVAIIDGRATSEASGRITEHTARAIAATGVDLISVGWLTHSSRSLDLALDVNNSRK